MSLQDLASALPSAGGASHADLLNSLWGQMYRSLPDDVSFEAENPLLTGTGIVVPGVIYNGIVYEYRADDTDSEHDGAVVLVLGGQYRYVTVGQGIDVNFVLSNTVTVPPDPEDEVEEDRPGLGDAYLVPAGAEGVWATKADKIAYWAGYHEWFYIDPTPGREIWVAGGSGGEDTKWHYDSVAGVWVTGFGANPLGSGVVLASNLNGAIRKAWLVLNQITNEPPESPSVNDAYVIGSSPTGSWAGQSFKVAVCEVAGTFTLYTPREGDVAYDISLNTAYVWDGAAWSASSGAMLNRDGKFTATGTTSDSDGSGYTISMSTAPTTSHIARRDDATLVFAARATSNKLKVTYDCHMTCSTERNVTIALFRDSEANALAWGYLDGVATSPAHFSIGWQITAPDALEHTYHIRGIPSVNTSNIRPDLFRRTFEIAEFPA